MMFHLLKWSMSLRGNNIFLVGMPGSGKSTIGRQLAEQLHFSFIDLDEEIEKNVGATVQEIFRKYGEDHFRELERQALLNVVKGNTGAVISTGGGTPCFFDNLTVIKSNGISIFIDTSPAELLKRLSTAEQNKRPTLSDGKELSVTLNKLREERLPFYESADIHWDGRQNVDDLIVAIKDCMPT